MGRALGGLTHSTAAQPLWIGMSLVTDNLSCTAGSKQVESPAYTSPKRPALIQKHIVPPERVTAFPGVKVPLSLTATQTLQVGLEQAADPPPPHLPLLHGSVELLGLQEAQEQPSSSAPSPCLPLSWPRCSTPAPRPWVPAHCLTVIPTAKNQPRTAAAFSVEVNHHAHMGRDRFPSELPR